jgi:AraC family transcriptional regulator
MTSTQLTNVPSSTPLIRDAQRAPQAGALPTMDRPRGYGTRPGGAACREAPGVRHQGGADPTEATVEISPAHIVRRRIIAWDGMAAEIVQATYHEKIECRFCAPRHLLAVCEQGARSDGDTLVEGAPRSSLKDLKKKLTFVPAGHEYREWQRPRVLTRVAYFYFEPAKLPLHSDSEPADVAPRLHFEDAAMWDTALKLMMLIEKPDADSGPYLESLGNVLAHELARLNAGAPRVQAPSRGGLASWQQRAVAAYIEEHLADQISLATLARLIGLSPHHFCRAFKQSFGLPPHRYHTSRRIECAKVLLAKPAPSVTDIALTLGFNETSSFSAVFRKTTGFSPTAYHRSLG